MLWITALIGCGLVGGPSGRVSEGGPLGAAVQDGANGGSAGTAQGGEHTPARGDAGNDHQSTHNAVVVGRDDAGNKGVRVGGTNGVVVGANEEVDGVRIGGEYGVMAGSADDTKGVQIGGDKGVLLGADDDTKGVRLGGNKGVVIDGKKGLKIGGKKLIGR